MQRLELRSPDAEVLLDAGAICSANGKVIDLFQCLLLLSVSPKALQRTSLPEPRLVILVIYSQGILGSIQGLCPVAKLDRGLRDVLQNRDVQVGNHLVPALVVIGQLELLQVEVRLAPGRQGLADIAIGPLDVAVLPELLPHVHDLCHGVSVADNPLALVGLFLLFLSVLDTAVHGLSVLSQHFRGRLVTAVVDLLPHTLEFLQLCRLLQELLEGNLILLRLAQVRLERYLRNLMVQDGGH
mmetsp:Transcript_15318/g.45898  ORF Transcript_15318/g.45898 Transcript_15318/m.45898 type:complete len:241 (-) Transcript_15318:672-1394(-)